MASTTDSLAGKSAWVTGSSRGIGRVIATHLAGLGCNVAVHGTTPTSARAFGEAPPEMTERKAGRIVNISSVDGLFGTAQRAMYATAKAAVIEYTRCLAAQMRPYDVAVNAVAPGGILTPRFVATRPVDEART